MRSQLAFSWRAAGSPVAEESSRQSRSSPRRADASARRVTFAVHNVPPSPLVYHAHNLSDAEDRDERDAHRNLEPPLGAGSGPRPSPSLAKTAVPAKSTSPFSTKAAAKPRARPGWNDSVARGSSLFDGSLKKAALFQARPGDRKHEADDHEVHMRERRGSAPKQNTKSATRRPSSGLAFAGGRTRKRVEPQSSGYMVRPSYQLPPKPRKDFVKGNIEQITGRSVEMLHSDKRPPRRSLSRNVFERLTAPRMTNLLLQTSGRFDKSADATVAEELHTSLASHSPPSDTSNPTVPQALETVIDCSEERDGNMQASIVLEQGSSLRFEEGRPSRSNSDRSGSPRPPTRANRQQNTYSSGSRRSGSPGSQSTSGIPRSTRANPQPSYAARVFAVLDREEQRRIGVDQTLQGLRLLGLPATHNQISDYVYLIHEGRSTTIDLEEWEILVGTLDAASRPSDSMRSTDQIETSSERSAFSIESPGRGSARGSSPPSISRHRSSPNTMRSSPSPVDSDRRITPRSGHESSLYSSPDSMQQQQRHEHLEIDKGVSDPAVQDIQRCVDKMCQQAEASASLRRATGLGRSNQTEDDSSSSSRHILNTAASVVYSLKASLFPLVHQAEEALKQIRQRQGYKLSVVLSPEDVQAVARNSEVLASAILDDVLLDMVQLLNDEEKRQSQQHVAALHADQLDDILRQIQQIEQNELYMLKHQPKVLAMTPKYSSWERDHTLCEDQQGGNIPLDDPPKITVPGGQDVSRMVLPLEVVMNVHVPSEEELTEPSCHEPLGTIDKGSNWPSILNSRVVSTDLPLIRALPLIKTSILQGKRLQTVEKRRTQFLKHRRLAEAALADTGMAQSAIIEILEELLVMDVIEEAAAELEDTVITISDSVVTNLL